MAEHTSTREEKEHLVMNLRGLALRMQGRVEAIEDRDGKENAVTGTGVGIGYLLARDLAKTLSGAADFIEHPRGSGSANADPSSDATEPDRKHPPTATFPTPATEGQPQPVAWRFKFQGSWFYSTTRPAEKTEEPLYACPPSPELREALGDRIYDQIHKANGYTLNDGQAVRKAIRAALSGGKNG